MAMETVGRLQFLPMSTPGAAERSTAAIDPGARIGKVSLAVADLERQVEFYRRLLGFRLHWREGPRAGLGAGAGDLVEFVETPGAGPRGRTTGLYHFAVLFPDKRELARAVARLFEAGYPNHPTDHVMTQTTYLTDPEGQEVELYADTPEEGTWTFEGGEFSARRADDRPSNGLEPLDVERLFRELSPGERLDLPLPAETQIGHVHLYVRDLAEAMQFYTAVVGFEEKGIAPRFKMGFVSAGGYHHHVGLNTWMGEGAPPPPPGSLGLRHFTVELPSREGLESVEQRVRAAGAPVERVDAGILARDPSENALLLRVAPR
jgi:catechol 2,3-dioxygenase